MRLNRKRVDAYEINQERWMISYADFITLLFGFFVVMYSISQVSESKYRVLSATLNEIFTDTNLTIDPIQVGDPARDQGDEVFDNKALKFNAEAAGAFDKTAELPQLLDQFQDQFSDLIDDEVITVNSNEYWLQLSFNNSLLFPLGSVRPGDEAEEVIYQAAQILKGFDNPVQIEGYTDNQPVSSAQFPSNWELSSARAAAVVKLMQKYGVAPQRMAAVGYGEHKPIADNRSAEGRAQNRRVVMMIAREKRQRPRINTRTAVAEVVAEQERKVFQVNPQPGLQGGDTTGEVLSAKDKMDLLIDNNDGLGLGTVLQAGQDTGADGRDEAFIPDELPLDGGNSVAPVRTRKGLLFSSDPDLPRNP